MTARRRTGLIAALAFVRLAIVPLAIVPLALSALAVSALAGCDIPSRPAWWPTDPPTPTETPGTAQSATTRGDAVPTVVRPWRTGTPQLGVNVYWDEYPPDSPDSVRGLARRTLDYVIGLNANAVTVNFPFFMDTPWADTVRSDPGRTPGPDRLAIFVDEAKRSGLRVTIRPVLDERLLVAADPDAWRGTIQPADRSAWFASYQRFLLPYAAMAQASTADELVAGVELNSLQSDGGWDGVITALREQFHGEVSYSQNFDAYERGLRLPTVDSAGIDAYFGLELGDRATSDALSAGWSDWIDTYVDDPARTVLHEVGIAAQDGAYHHPAQWGDLDVPLNLDVQQHWYEAICRAAQERGLAGLYFWSIRLHAVPGQEGADQADRMAFVDRPAEGVIRNCYADFAA